MSLYASATAAAARTVADGCGVHATGVRVSTAIALVPTAPGHARRVLNEVLAEWGLGHLEDTADLILSELVTNALLHGQEPARLTVYTDPNADGGFLFIEVDDAGDHTPELRDAASDAEDGRGLTIVEALSADWGVEATETGKRVWASITLGSDAEAGR